MKIVANRAALLDAVSIVAAVLNSRTPKPVLSCILLAATADDNRITLRATDLEASVQACLADAQVEEGGAVAIPAELFRELLRETPEETVSLESDKTYGVVHLRTESSAFRVNRHEASDFPPEPELDEVEPVTVPLTVLLNQIRMTEFAAARESTKFAIGGTLFKLNGKFEAAATDGRRLAYVCAPLAKKLRKEVSALIPAKALKLLAKLKAEDEDVEIRIGENRAQFRMADVTIATNLIEGQFPPYQDVIPKDSNRKATLSADAFAGALRRASLLSDGEEGKGLKMTFNAKGLVLNSRSPDAGEATVNLPCKFEGDPIDIGFRPQYLVEALKVAGGDGVDEVTLEMSAPNRPGLLKAGDDFLYVVMPINLQ